MMALSHAVSSFRFSGYASLFNLADLSGDRVMMGAFHRSLKARGAAGIRMLWNHDPAEPIGVWTSITEDALGLKVEGRLTADVERSTALSHLIKDGALDGLSIGFHTVRSDKPKALKGQKALRRLIEVDLWEISLVAFPMQPGARISTFEPRESMPTTQPTPVSQHLPPHHQPSASLPL